MSFVLDPRRGLRGSLEPLQPAAGVASAPTGGSVTPPSTVDLQAPVDEHVAEADPHAQYVLETGLNELVDDRVAALLQAGPNVTLTYNDTANTLTIGATGGGGGTLSPPVSANLRRSVDLVVANNTPTALSWTQVVSDIGLGWDPGQPTRLTAPVSGFYWISLTLEWSTSGASVRDCWFLVNGVATVAASREMGSSVGNVRQQLVHGIQLSAGDYVEAIVAQSTGGNLTVLAVPAYTPNISIARVSASLSLPTFASVLATGLVAAYSLRGVVVGYTGPLIRLRRSSDNVESDFSAVGGWLDTAAVLAWVGAGNSAFVRTWYDQSGGARHLQMTTVGTQPAFVTAGAITARCPSGRPAVRTAAATRLDDSTGLWNDSNSACVAACGDTSSYLVRGRDGAGAGWSFDLQVIGARATLSTPLVSTFNAQVSSALARPGWAARFAEMAVTASGSRGTFFTRDYGLWVSAGFTGASQTQWRNSSVGLQVGGSPSAGLFNPGTHVEILVWQRTPFTQAERESIDTEWQIAYNTRNAYDEAVLLDRPVQYLRLDEAAGTTAFDLAAPRSGQTGTYGGAVAPGGAGPLVPHATMAPNFDATPTGLNGNGFVNTNLTTDYTAQFAVECVFRAAASQPDALPHLVSKAQHVPATAPDFPVRVLWLGGNRVELQLSAGNDLVVDATLATPATLAASTTYHLVVNYRANGLCEIYIDGALAASVTIGFTINARNTIAWRVGAATEQGAGAGASGFNGAISHFALYPFALPGARVLAHYNARNG